jgi:hypothetical protein
MITEDFRGYPKYLYQEITFAAAASRDSTLV